MVRRALLVATATVLMSGLGLGQPMQGMGQMQGQAGQGPRQRLMQTRERGIERLNLTDEQKKEMQKLRFDLQKKDIPIQSQVQLARLDIREQMAADKPDKAKIEKLMKQVSDLQLQMKLNRLDHLFAVRNILTPEQLKEWHGMTGSGRQMMQRRGRTFRQGMGMREPPEGPGETMGMKIPLEKPGNTMGMKIPLEKPGNTMGMKIPLEKPGDTMGMKIPLEKPGDTMGMKIPLGKPGDSLAMKIPLENPNK